MPDDAQVIDSRDLSVFVQNWQKDVFETKDATLRGHWGFNDGSGFVCVDDSIYGSDGIKYDMDDSAWVAGKVGSALYFDGGEGRVEVNGYYGIGGGTSRTVCAWIRTNTPGRVIIAWGLAAAGNRWTMAVDSAGHLRQEVGGGAIVGSTPVSDGAWHHVAVVLEKDGTPNINEVKLYVDGLPDEPSSNGSDRAIDTLADPDVTIGQYLGARFFQGTIDEVRIYDRALTDEEIAAFVP